MLIDTHAAVRELEAAGIETSQAEAIVRTIAKADETIATKADVNAVRTEIRTLRSEMRWLLGFMGALVLAIAGHIFGVLS